MEELRDRLAEEEKVVDVLLREKVKGRGTSLGGNGEGLAELGDLRDGDVNINDLPATLEGSSQDDVLLRRLREPESKGVTLGEAVLRHGVDVGLGVVLRDKYRNG